MREPRNPFRLRTSENIEDDYQFVRLFGAEVLDLLPEAELWSGIRLIRSAPGGGKTSLLRVFEPGPLRALQSLSKTDETARVLYGRLNTMGVFSPERPVMLSVRLSCARNYATLEHSELNAHQRERVFFALLNVRILVASLRALLDLERLSFPQDLARITIQSSEYADGLRGLRFPVNGAEVWKWAADIEANVCHAIDDFASRHDAALTGHDSIFSLGALTPGAILVDGEQRVRLVAVMIDDVDKLTFDQRAVLFHTLVALRPPVPVWLAERLEAMGHDELLASGAEEGREYTLHRLDELWRGRHRTRFETFCMDIADRRAQQSSSEIASLAPLLEADLNAPEWQAKHVQVADSVEQRVRAQTGDDVRFRSWVNHLAATGIVAPRDRALSWRALEIVIAREKRKAQATLAFELPESSLATQDDANVRAAAELFLADEFGLPYYFGASMMARLASSNIQQFLVLGGELFEEMVANRIIKSHAPLKPERQDVIVRRAAKALLNDIPRRMAHGREARALIDGIGAFARQYTYQSSAPNDPGVSGIAISMSDRDALLDRAYIERRPELRDVAEVIAVCIAHNLLEPRLDYGVKGKRWMVLNLNRLICAAYDLPLHYGKFKEQRLATLANWMRGGLPKKQARLLHE